MKYTQEQLQAAFQLVQDKKHWKNPISYLMRPDDNFDLIVSAIQHFTATFPSVDIYSDRVSQIYYLRINSIGYRAGPAGDH
jgi:hypothetical protein